MAFVKTTRTDLSGGKQFYGSDAMKEKLTYYINTGDVNITNSTEGEVITSTQTWSSEEVYNEWQAWLVSSGERANITAYNTANGIVITQV